jgi:pilus assembly protein Flp/PilA
MTNLMTRVRALLRDDEGQDLIEYALLAGLIALVCVATLTTAGESVSEIWTEIDTKLGTAADAVGE